MIYKIKKCKECNHKARAYYHKILLCGSCYLKLKNKNNLNCIK